MSKIRKYHLIIFFYLIIIACDKFSNKTKELNNSIKVVEKINTKDDKISDRFFYEQWSINKNDIFYKQNNINDNANINMGDLLSKYSGKGVKIAVLDVGFNDKHKDLEGAVINTYNMNTKSKNIFNHNSGVTHATSVAGIISARKNSLGILGIAYESELIFLELPTGQNATDVNLILTFRKAVDLGADIINCSWGTYNVSDVLKNTLIDIATNAKNGKGIPIVFSSGNDSKNMGNDESNIDEIISVGATNINNLKAIYTNFGKNLDFMVPGGYKLGITTLGTSYLTSTYRLSRDDNRFMGTSASAPIVSGIIALMLEKNPKLSRIEIENILKETADKIGTLDYIEDRNNYYGYGKINVTKAMKKVIKDKFK